MKDKTFTMRWDAETERRARVVANAKRRSRADLVRLLIDEAYKQLPAAGDGAQQGGLL